jgi:hypothetical protein
MHRWVSHSLGKQLYSRSAYKLRADSWPSDLGVISVNLVLSAEHVTLDGRAGAGAHA